MSNLKYLFIALFFVACSENETCSDNAQNQNEVATDCGGSCSPCDIEYSTSGDYGKNILSADDIMLLADEESYSMSATIPKGSSLKVKLVLLGGNPYFYAGEDGWNVSEYENNQQTFTANDDGEIDLELSHQFTSSDSIHVKFYENGHALTKITTLVWN